MPHRYKMRINVRLTEEEHASLTARAEAASLPLSTMLRCIVLDEVDQPVMGKRLALRPELHNSKELAAVDSK